MIHFRYHLLSLTAVFFALGVGILLGGMAGHSWFTVGEQEVLAKMEAKYDRALKSNNELKQQMNRLLMEVERSNEEVIHLMAMRYSHDLSGSKVFVWNQPDLKLAPIKQLLQSVGVDVLPYQEGATVENGLLLVFAHEEPEWVSGLPAPRRWLRIEQVPDSPAKQWALLDKVQKLLAEMRLEHEKS
ncbi:copper transporter [Brevibacillus choshinensis]|uniref:copper transporter n=1 Tax=Brevibacillus choshinensis TaxID=54911 RepID=UPI002E1D404A|nr:copper transporter [Brevibacillus choshinensis]MED4581519.1 copper transporter [Brevibacillus choshinensis]MED4751175.1 copper transporter [Brevibacillus choshinensis]MED4783305.1 copper transporter [Brevibacillus choshinensis]